jgi:phosphohistidine phosphatase
MKRLLLVRHAKASKDDPRLADADRPLTERGERDAAEMGRRITRRGPHPDSIVASPARRALETAKVIARELDFPWRQIRQDPRIYEAEADELLEVVRDLDGGVEIALLVGHNPGFSELAQLLAKDFHEDLPTCGAVVLEFAADTWRGVRRGGGRLLAFDSPKMPPPG